MLPTTQPRPVQHRVAVAATLMIGLMAGPALAADPPPASAPAPAATPATPAAERTEEVSIPFANHGGVRNWKAIDSRALLIEGPRHQWYKAELFGPCIDLPYANAIGFLVEPSGALDRYSGIVVRDQVCRFKSLTKAENPYKKTDRPDADSK